MNPAMILDEFNRWLPLLSGLAALLWPFALYHLSRRFVGKADFETLLAVRGRERAADREAREGIAGRVGALERRMETVPDAKDMHAIQLSLGELRGDVKSLDARMEGLEASISGLENQIAMLVQHHLEISKS